MGKRSEEPGKRWRERKDMIQIYCMKKKLRSSFGLTTGDFIKHTVGEFRITVRGLYIIQSVLGDEAVRENVHQNPGVERGKNPMEASVCKETDLCSKQCDRHKKRIALEARPVHKPTCEGQTITCNLTLLRTVQGVRTAYGTQPLKNLLKV